MSGAHQLPASFSWQCRGERGFTLLELLVVIGIISILSAVAIPFYSEFKETARVGRTAADLKTFGTGFNAYAALHEDYPNDSHLVLPPGAGMEEFLPEEAWLAETPLGGNYNWEGPDGYPYAGISLTGVTVDADVIEKLDRMMDDGNLMTGVFRQTPNGRYTYILDE